MHNTTPYAIGALHGATTEAESLKKLSENAENEQDRLEALKLSHKAAKRAKRLQVFLSKFVR